MLLVVIIIFNNNIMNILLASKLRAHGCILGGVVRRTFLVHV